MLPDSPIPKHCSYKTSIPFGQNEQEQEYFSNSRVGPQRMYSFKRKRGETSLKRNQTFNCTPVHVPIQNTSVSPMLSSKAKIIKKKLSIDSLNGYNRRKSRRHLEGNEETSGYGIDHWQNTPNTTSPNKLRYKKNSMIETKKEFEYQRRFNRIPSVVIWHEPSINDNQIQSYESQDIEVKQKSHSETLQEHNNNTSNCHKNAESHV